MKPQESQATAESEIRALMENTATACRAKDSVALTANYDPDVRAFDVVNPLQYSGSAEVAKRAEEWFASWQGSFDYEIHNLNITASDSVAFCHSLNHVNGTKTDGQKVDMWWRATVCFSKLNSKWKVTHLHSSVPFDMETGKASLDIKP